MQTKKGDILPDVLHPCEQCRRQFMGVKTRKFCPECTSARDRDTRRRANERKKLGLTDPHPLRHRTTRLRVSNSKVTVFKFRTK